MSLHRKDQRGARFVQPDNWHITLRFLGDAQPGVVIDALSGVQPAPAVAQIGPGVDCFDERVLVIPVTGLDALAEDVRARVHGLGTQPAPKRFLGHVTVARVKANVPMPRALGSLISSSFEVTEIALIQSRLEERGARYETLETWPVG